MEVGDVQQTVDVTAEPPLLENKVGRKKARAFSTQMMTTLPFFFGRCAQLLDLS